MIEELLANFGFPVALVVILILGIRAAGRWAGPFISKEVWPAIKANMLMKEQAQIETARRLADERREAEAARVQQTITSYEQLNIARETFRQIVETEREYREKESKQTLAALANINTTLIALTHTIEKLQGEE